jgi:hypothetical protein
MRRGAHNLATAASTGFRSSMLYAVREARIAAILNPVKRSHRKARDSGDIRAAALDPARGRNDQGEGLKRGDQAQDEAPQGAA